MIGATASRTKDRSAEDALHKAMNAVGRNLVAYSEGEVYTAATEKDREIKRIVDALCRSQNDLAAQIAVKLDELHSPATPASFPMDYTRFNFVSYRAILPKMMEELQARHNQVAAMRNELLEKVRNLSDAAALLTAAKVLHEKAIEKLNVQAAGICPPVSLPADPREIAPLVPTVKIIEVHEQAPGVVVAAPAAPAADGHGHGGHDEHAAPAHDDHGHGGHDSAHATATAHAEPTPVAKAPEPAKVEAPKAEAAKAPEPAAPEPAHEEKKAAADEEPGFVATWKTEKLGPLQAGKTNFILASESTSADELTKLARDANHLVRHNVAVNPATPKDVVKGLTGDESIHVRRAARKLVG
jgi:hypothetical protein